MLFKRFFTQTVTKSIKFSIPKQVQPSTTAIKQQSQVKWQPTNGNSFRSFAEYRLKVSNQSPLAVRSKDFNLSLRHT
ncbi:unnamed protein product [Candida verbasci]|uniref:Uncharacterized protein n=1 Tax=Candida verbasci TaxID=1227364 RepID=A0A9W4TY29_9ASCO|nr:unnamed protein product [Candida verbasci]